MASGLIANTKTYREMAVQTDPFHGPTVQSVETVQSVNTPSQEQNDVEESDVKPDLVEILKLKLQMCANTIRKEDLFDDGETIELD